MSLVPTAVLLALALAMVAVSMAVARRPLEIGRIRPPTAPFLFVGLIASGLLALHLASLVLGMPLGGGASSP